MRIRLFNIAFLLGSFMFMSCSGDVPLVTTLPVTEITPRSALSGGIILDEGSSAIIERGVCWNTTNSPSLSSDRSINGSGIGTYLSEMLGLLPSTEYFLRAYATNKVGTSYGNEITFVTTKSEGDYRNRIIADHTVVDKYDDIPQVYIDKVKRMLVHVPGMSHATGYFNGANLLESLDNRFQVTTFLSGDFPEPSDSYLRMGKVGLSSSGTWAEEMYRDYHGDIIQNQYELGNPISVFLYGWCWDMTWNNAPGGTRDPIYGVRWAGDAGIGRWGLDNDDNALTGNTVNMGTYLAAIQEWNSFCQANSIPTVVVYTTAPVDEVDNLNGGTENSYQREIKQNYIRNHVASDNTRILFDFADILIYNNSGEKYQVAWNDNGTQRYHDQMHPDNRMDYNASWNIVDEQDADGDHIGEVGALRLAKAMWWMLARIAGWDGT